MSNKKQKDWNKRSLFNIKKNNQRHFSQVSPGLLNKNMFKNSSKQFYKRVETRWEFNKKFGKIIEKDKPDIKESYE